MRRETLALILGTTTACAVTDARLDDEQAAEVETSASEIRSADDDDEPGDRGADPTIRSVPIATGVTISFLEQGRKDGDVLLFLHGYTDSHRSFDLDLPRLPRRYHVFAIDQRGHGDSSKPACCYTQADFAADVAAFLDAVGVERATIVGHSMGSLVAHKFAIDYPSRVVDLVLVGSAPTLAGNPVALGFKSVVDTLTDPVDPAFVREFQASTFYRPIPPSFLDTVVSESLKVPAAVWQQALDGMLAEDHTADLSRIRARRTAIFWGDQDIFFGLAEQQLLDDAIPRSRLFVYPETGHGLHAERPARFMHDLARVLR